jgi:hypothetical protein
MICLLSSLEIKRLYIELVEEIKKLWNKGFLSHEELLEKIKDLLNKDEFEELMKWITWLFNHGLISLELFSILMFLICTLYYAYTDYLINRSGSNLVWLIPIRFEWSNTPWSPHRWHLGVIDRNDRNGIHLWNLFRHHDNVARMIVWVNNCRYVAVIRWVPHYDLPMSDDNFRPMNRRTLGQDNWIKHYKFSFLYPNTIYWLWNSLRIGTGRHNYYKELYPQIFQINNIFNIGRSIYIRGTEYDMHLQWRRAVGTRNWAWW